MRKRCGDWAPGGFLGIVDWWPKPLRSGRNGGELLRKQKGGGTGYLLDLGRGLGAFLRLPKAGTGHPLPAPQGLERVENKGRGRTFQRVDLVCGRAS